LIFSLIEQAGVNGAAGLTRNQLKIELQKKTEISLDQFAELTTLLDMIDRILFTSAAGKEVLLPPDSADTVERLRRIVSGSKGPR
ncbi:MAG: hypothetical protein HGA62_02795, partial [Chlorobiaceae bacterium]|nr:hypothetical protein [Chlorobiaceae bacterium]